MPYNLPPGGPGGPGNVPKTLGIRQRQNTANFILYSFVSFMILP